MKIVKGRMTVEGENLVETEDGITCGCEKPSLKTIMHLDCTDYYSTTYKCDCGNTINVTCERTEEDKMFWQD